MFTVLYITGSTSPQTGDGMTSAQFYVKSDAQISAAQWASISTSYHAYWYDGTDWRVG
jgi:uncharacterized protein YcfL